MAYVAMVLLLLGGALIGCCIIGMVIDLFEISSTAIMAVGTTMVLASVAFFALSMLIG